MFNQRSLSNTLVAALLCLAAGSTSAIESQPISTQHIQQTSAIAAQSLDLQPGDQALIANALRSPVAFVEAQNQRTFTGQLIVHAKANKAQRANARVMPITVRSSMFVDEHVIDVPAGMSEGELAAILLATGDYEFVEPNWTLYPTITPNDSQFGSSWQHTRLQSTAAWDLHTGNSNVIVAICDSGVDDNHPDLQASLISGFNAANGQAEVNGGLVDDINGHGTFVAGCAAARGNNNTGVVGVGWNFSIMPIRVTNNTNGTASFFALQEGSRWAAENGAHVVNVSFTGGTSASNQTLGSYLKSLGSLLFWASGNAGSFISPNRPDYVIVGSTTSSDNRSGFSNFGPAVDITAPGSSVRSTRRGGSYGNGSGTSYASPIAAGVGAMIYSVNPDFNGDDVQYILYNSVDDLGAPGRDDSFGRGRVNTRKAIELAQTYIPPTIIPIAESFESIEWQDLFVATSGTVQTSMPADAPSGLSVLELDANDIVETSALAGRRIQGQDYLSFALKATDIEPGETLEIQYLQDPEVSPANTWTTFTTITGEGLSSSEFVAYDFEIPTSYEWHGTKIRFVANGSDASDVWMIDSFSIDTLAEPVAPLVEHFESGAISPFRWDEAIGAQVAFDAGNFSLELTDADSIESQDVPLEQFGIVPAYIYFDAWADNQVSPADELAVEVLNIVDVWVLVGTVSGGDLTSNAQVVEFDVPITAIGIDEMRLRLTATTTGAINIDNVYVGVDPYIGNAGCNIADLAEPFGTLNFFDISAFLAAFNSSEPVADINNDGVFNFFDISAYLNEYAAGCP